jgi:hypothetical protein
MQNLENMGVAGGTFKNLERAVQPFRIESLSFDHYLIDNINVYILSLAREGINYQVEFTAALVPELGSRKVGCGGLGCAGANS